MDEQNQNNHPEKNQAQPPKPQDTVSQPQPGGEIPKQAAPDMASRQPERPIPPAQQPSAQYRQPAANIQYQRPPESGPYEDRPNAPQPDEKRGLGIASMVLGIVAMITSCAWFLGIPCAIVGLVLGIISNNTRKNGMAIAGIVLSIVYLALIVLGIILGISTMNIIQDLNYYY